MKQNNFLENNCMFSLLEPELLQRCKPFNCGNNDLDDFFLNQSVLYSTQLLGKTYCFRLDNDQSTIACTITVKDIQTAVETIDGENKVYPRLIENVLYVELLKAETIYVIHVSGRIQETIRGQAGINTIAAGSYPSGIYFIRLEDQTVKVIKK